MNVTLTRRYTFCAAHHLVGMRERHKCSGVHGHNYALELTVSGPRPNGLIIDTADLDICMGPVLARLDHGDLNALAAEGGAAAILAQPSVENIVEYLWGALAFLRRESTGGFQLHRLRVYENERTWAEAAAAHGEPEGGER